MQLKKKVFKIATRAKKKKSCVWQSQNRLDPVNYCWWSIIFYGRRPVYQVVRDWLKGRGTSVCPTNNEVRAPKEWFIHENHFTLRNLLPNSIVQKATLFDNTIYWIISIHQISFGADFNSDANKGLRFWHQDWVRVQTSSKQNMISVMQAR